MNNEGFALRSFLVIIGLSMVVVLTVFLIQKRDSRTERITELYERYLQDRSIDDSEEILSEGLISEIRERGPASILCTDIVPDDATIDSVEENEGTVNLSLNYLEEPVRLIIEDDSDLWKIVRIECPSVNFETEIEEEDSVIEEREVEVEEEARDPEIPAVSRAKEDLSVRLDVDIIEIESVTVEAVVFSDSTLGTSAPGEMYEQKLTPGYLIVLSVNEKEYRYHADATRAIFIQ